MSNSFLFDNNSSNFDGLILLGSYTTSDLSQTNINIISIYGMQDGDGTTTISNEQQITLASDLISKFILNN